MEEGKAGEEVKTPKPLEGRRQEKEEGGFSDRETSGKVWEEEGGSFIGGRLEEGLRSRGNTSTGS